MNRLIRQKYIVPGIVCISMWVTLFLFTPYSGGFFGSERSSLATNVIYGYLHTENGEWSFGFIVLPATMIMLWMTRERYRILKVEPSNTGLVIIILSLLFYLIGFRAFKSYIGYFSMHALVMGMIVWFLGWRYFFVGFWLWVFAGIMWPLPQLIDLISFPLRKVATETSVFLWNLCGGDAIQNGTSILSAGSGALREGASYSLKVADACSGMRSLFALIMISLIFAYIGVKKEAHRWIVVISMIPVAVIGNVVRIILLLLGTIWWGNDIALGTDAEPSTYHLAAGFAVYFVALSVMFILVMILNGGGRKKVITKKTGDLYE